jgi:hypothetical protein
MAEVHRVLASSRNLFGWRLATSTPAAAEDRGKEAGLFLSQLGVILVLYVCGELQSLQVHAVTSASVSIWRRTGERLLFNHEQIRVPILLDQLCVMGISEPAAGAGCWMTPGILRPPGLP